MAATETSPPSGTVTLLFSDIEGSTRLWEGQSAEMATALETHDNLLSDAIETHGGYVFYRGGDSFGAAFAAPSDALAAAITMQQGLKAAVWPGDTGPLRVRMGLHTGQLEERNGDYLGPPVNRVARLMSAGHGGQILLSLATQELVRDDLPEGIGLTDLGKHRLKDLSHPETIFQVTGPDLEAAFAELVTLDSQRTNLPSQATPFIGRQRESEDLRDLLGRDEVRLVTLTGPGGVGKTRLSLQVAADLLDDFGDGVLFVELAPITDSNLVAATIASTLGITTADDDSSIESLIRSISKKRILLVIDNFEHVIDAAFIVSDLIARAPALKIITSSREVLRIYGEHEYPVPPLALPDDSQPQTVAMISEYEAVSLFLQRAKAAKPDFEIAEDNAHAIAAVCRRLEGLPLAIELAAARVRLFDIQTLLARLSDSLKTLTGGARDVPGRQQTIRAAIEWSHDLLNDDEKAFFARLGVFRGGRSGEAIEAVCGPGLAIDVWDGLESLLNKSLLRRDDGPEGEPRFVMLETIHAYASERLTDTSEVEEVHQRHAEFFAELAEQAKTELNGPDQGMWLNRLFNDYENLRKAMEWALAGGDIQTGLRLVASLGFYWVHKSHLQEGIRWSRAALDLADQAPDSVHADILTRVGWIAWGLGERAEAKRAYEQALPLQRKLGNQSAVARILASLGLMSTDSSGVDLEISQEGVALAREIGDEYELSYGLNVVGEIHRLRGDYVAAKHAYEEALQVAHEIGDRYREAMLLANLGLVAFNLDETAVASARFLESYKLALETGNDYITAEGLVWGGASKGALGDPERGIRLMAAGAMQQAAIGSQTQPQDQYELDKLIALIRDQVDDETFDRLWAEGESLSLEEAIKLRLQEE